MSRAGSLLARRASRPRPRPWRRGEEAALGVGLKPGVEVDRELAVGVRAPGAGGVRGDRKAVARRLTQPDVAGDHGIQHQVSEALAHLVHHLVGEGQATVVKGEHDAGDAELGVELAAEQADGVGEQAETLQGVELALDGDDQRPGRHHRVDGEEPEARRAVEEHVVERVVGERLERIGESLLAAGDPDQLDLRARQGDVRGYEVEAGDGRGHPSFGDRPAQHHDVVGAGGDVAAGHAQAGGGVGLGVAVDDEDAPSDLREVGCDVDHRGGLAHPALLVGDGEDQRRHGCDYAAQ
jgi:hypothetical protein